VELERELTYSAPIAEIQSTLLLAIRAAIRESRTFRIAVCLQLFASAIICGLAGRPMLTGLGDAYQTFLGAAVVFGLLVLAIVVFQRRRLAADPLRVGEAYRQAWNSLLEDTLTPDYIANVLIVFAIAPVAICAFSAAKQSIPFVHPFTWDARIAALGTSLHGGRPMWALLQPALGHPKVTVFLDWFYHRFWTAVMLGAFVAGTLLRPSALRRQYLMSIVLLFLIVGTLGALALSSAGPAYYAQVVSSTSDPYAPLFNYLRSVNGAHGLIAVRGEATLWFAYTHRLEGFGYGVSAMPSVHVASATLTALFGFQIDRRLGVLLTVIAVCVWVGSVNLGWHYSLDGCVGALLACCIWWLSGRVALTSGSAIDLGR
jgi:hypothetical protein